MEKQSSYGIALSGGLPSAKAAAGELSRSQPNFNEIMNSGPKIKEEHAEETSSLTSSDLDQSGTASLGEEQDEV